MSPDLNTVPIGIRKLEIKNFRGVEELKLSFLNASRTASDIVVLAGPNGCGKTTVLEACLFAVGHPDSVRGPIGREGVRKGAVDYQVSASITTPHGEYDTSVGSAGEQVWRNTPKGWTSRLASLPCLYFSSWRGPRLVGAVSITAGTRDKRPDETESNRVWLSKQYLVNAKAHAFMREAPLSGSAPLSPYETILQRLNDVWASFYPGSRQQFTVEPLGDDPEAGFDVFLSVPSGAKVPLDDLSSGQLELFALFGSLLRLKFDEGLLIIDEPELHLDPQWHALLLRALRELLPRVQLIVATHSPRVYDSVLSFQRHFLVSDSDPRAIAWKQRPLVEVE
jgi:energy-coupling factor transporter ATP-binding protein EcfA2